MNSEIGLFEHFRLLLSFGGKEDRGSFWPYAALVLGILTACNLIMMMPMMMALSHPFDGDMGMRLPNVGLYFVVVIGLAVLLYAAAVARRLRDSGRAIWWGLMPLPFVIVSSIGISQMFASPFDGTPPNMSLFQWMFLANGLYTLTLIALIVLLAMPSAAARDDRQRKDNLPAEYHEE